MIPSAGGDDDVGGDRDAGVDGGGDGKSGTSGEKLQNSFQRIWERVNPANSAKSTIPKKSTTSDQAMELVERKIKLSPRKKEFSRARSPSPLTATASLGTVTHPDIVQDQLRKQMLQKRERLKKLYEKFKNTIFLKTEKK